MQPNEPGTQKPFLQNDDGGGICLLYRRGTCEVKLDPNNAFNNFFPDLPNSKLPQAEAAITRDRAIDLIRRAERAPAVNNNS